MSGVRLTSALHDCVGVLVVELGHYTESVSEWVLELCISSCELHRTGFRFASSSSSFSPHWKLFPVSGRSFNLIWNILCSVQVSTDWPLSYSGREREKSEWNISNWRSVRRQRCHSRFVRRIIEVYQAWIRYRPPRCKRYDNYRTWFSSYFSFLANNKLPSYPFSINIYFVPS